MGRDRSTLIGGSVQFWVTRTAALRKTIQPEMIDAVFSPDLGDRHVAVSRSTVQFFALWSGAGDQLLEVYHSLRGRWEATPFSRDFDSKLSNLGSSGNLWNAQIALGDSTGGEFTFRLRHQSGQIDWHGSESSNGTIHVVEKTVRAPATETGIIRHPLASKEESSSGDVLPIPSWSISDGLVFERVKDSWAQPRRILATEEISDQYDTLFLAYRSADHQRVFVCLPLSTTDCATYLRREEGILKLRCTRDGGPDLIEGIAAVGEAPASQIDQLIHRLVEIGRQEVSLLNCMPFRALETKTRRQGLQYCTWNALGNWYSARQAADILRQLDEADPLFGKAIDGVILDDGWQNIVSYDDERGRRLHSFGAHEDFMPDRPADKNTVTDRRDSGYSSPSMDAKVMEDERRALEHLAKGIKLVRMQLDGCDPGSTPISLHFGPLVEYHHLEHGRPDVSSSSWWLPVASREGLERFWRGFFGELKEAGVDFVKVDNQSWLTDYALDAALRVGMSHRMTKAGRAVWQRDDAVTHCMSMTGRHMLGALGLGLLTDTEPVFRTSDDFFPNEPNSHRYHIYSNACLSLLTQHLSITPDFDMFQTGHEWAAFHAALRTFSPSPVLVTDTLDAHDPEIIKSLVGPCKNGKLAVVQTLAEKCFPLFPFDEVRRSTRPLKLGLHTACGAVIGLFNCNEKGDSVIGSLGGADLAAVLGSEWPPRRDDAWAIFHRPSSGHLVADYERLQDSNIVLAALEIAPQTCHVVAIAPMYVVGSTRIGCVGLVDKLNPLVAIRKISSASARQTSEITQSPATASLPPIRPPSLWRLLEDLGDHLLEPSLLDRLRQEPLKTAVDEVRFATQAILTFATLVLLHLFSITSPANRSAIEAERAPLLSREANTAEKHPEKSCVTGSVLRAEVDLAGRLGFLCADVDFVNRLGVTIDGQEVKAEHLSFSAGLLTVDMESATADLAFSSGDRWIVEVTQRQK